jgi:hypothetical protein
MRAQLCAAMGRIEIANSDGHCVARPPARLAADGGGHCASTDHDRTQTSAATPIAFHAGAAGSAIHKPRAGQKGSPAHGDPTPEVLFRGQRRLHPPPGPALLISASTSTTLAWCRASRSRRQPVAHDDSPRLAEYRREPDRWLTGRGRCARGQVPHRARAWQRRDGRRVRGDAFAPDATSLCDQVAGSAR